MAAGVRGAARVDVGVSRDRHRRPGRRTPEKPVGLVYLHAETPEGDGHRVQLPVRPRDGPVAATVAALHLVRRLLSQDRDSACDVGC
jgi:nicotinamide mononucleotide (NMN) deamidase PncC